MKAKFNTKLDPKVVKAILAGVSIPKAAKQFNVHPSTMADAYYRLEPIADPSLLISGTPKAVAKTIVTLRTAGMRWERLAARSGKSVKDVRAIYSEHATTPAEQHYCGRGRHYERRFTTPTPTPVTTTTRRSTKKAAA